MASKDLNYDLKYHFGGVLKIKTRIFISESRIYVYLVL